MISDRFYDHVCDVLIGNELLTSDPTFKTLLLVSCDLIIHHLNSSLLRYISHFAIYRASSLACPAKWSCS